MALLVLLLLLTSSLAITNNKINGSFAKTKIAIVGGGIGGTSCSYFLNQHLSDLTFEVTVFESEVVGGRLATVNMAGLEYEVGGSVIHPRNILMRDLTHQIGLNERPKASWVQDWDLGGFSIFSNPGEELFQKSSVWSIIAILQTIWHFGFLNLLKSQQEVSQMLSSFSDIYPFLGHRSNSTLTLQDLMQHMSKNLTQDSELSLAQLLSSKGIERILIDELAAAAVRTNYGQMPDDIHAFAGGVALAGAEKGLWAVEGGNKQVPMKLLQLSKAKLVEALVTEVALEKDGKSFRVSYNVANSNGHENVLFTEGKEDAKYSNQGLESKNETFDIVIMATPLTKDKSGIQFNGFPNKFEFPGRFHRTVATMVHGEVNPKFFGKNHSLEVSASNFFVNKDSNINSVALQAPVSIPSDKSEQDLPLVWKVFSQKPLTESELDKIFLSRSDTFVADWLAYPHYSYGRNKISGDFLLHEGLYHLNVIENAASAMEMSLIASKNVANHIVKLLDNQPRNNYETLNFVKEEL